MKARPIIQWFGGKQYLVKTLIEHFPTGCIHRYWEPFFGGGSMYFALSSRIQEAHLSDANEDLIAMYRVVRDSVDEVIDALRIHASRSAREPREYFNRVREQAPRSDVEAAARMVYMMRVCYGAKWNAGRPTFGRQHTYLVRASELRAASSALASAASIHHQDFTAITPQRGDVIYCDPPYHEAQPRYTVDGFNESDQVRLRDAVGKWVKSGATVVLSNSDTPFIRDLYSHYQIHAYSKMYMQSKTIFNELVITSSPRRHPLPLTLH